MTGQIEFFSGIGIVKSPWLPEFVPALKIGQDVPMTPEVRDSMNDWLEEMFGVKRHFVMISGKIVCHPNNYTILHERVGK